MQNLPSVNDGARHALRDKNAVTLGKISSSAGIALLAVLAAAASLFILHGINAAHATVRLDKLALPRHKRCSRGLRGTSQQSSHHHGGGAKGKSLDNVAHVLNTTVSDARHAEACGETADGVHSGGLRPTNGHDLLSDACRSTAHTNTKAVDAGGDERGGLLSGDDVASNDIKLRKLGLDPLDHLDLIHAVALRAIQNHNIETSVDQQLQPKFVLRTGADSRSAQKLLAVWLLGGQWEVLILGQIGAGDHGNKVEIFVHDWKLALFALSQDLICLHKSDTVGRSHEFRDHDISDCNVVVVLELKIAIGDNAQQRGAEFTVLYRRANTVRSIPNFGFVQ